MFVLSVKHFLRIYAGASCVPEGPCIKMANPGDFYHHSGMAEITLVALTLKFICIMFQYSNIVTYCQ